MARFSVIAAALASVLLATTALASPGAAVAVSTEECNPIACMSLAVTHSDCFNGFNPGPILPQGGAPKPTELTNCVCANAALKQAYLSCYGFCNLDPSTEPFCGQPVSNDAATQTGDVDAREAVAFKSPIDPHCEGPMCDKGDPDMAEVVNFCGVPGNMCGSKSVDVDVGVNHADFGITEPEHPRITSAAQLDDLSEQGEVDKRAPKTYTYSNWINFCGVPGNMCGEKAAEPTAEAGSNFVDVGDVQSENLEGKIGGGGKRTAAVEAPVPTTLQTVQDYLRPSI